MGSLWHTGQDTHTEKHTKCICFVCFAGEGSAVGLKTEPDEVSDFILNI